jgi:hypothetical protein
VTNFTKVQHAFSPYGDSQTVALASAAGSTDNRLFFATAQRSGASWGTYSFTDDNGGTWTRVLEQDFDLTDDAIDRRSFAAYVRQVIAADLTTAPSVSSIAAAANPSMQSVLIEFSADAAFDWTLAAEEAIGNTADDTEASSFALGSTGDPGGSDNFVIAFGILKRNTVAITSMEFDLSGGANVSLDGGSFGINLCVEWSAAGLAGAQSLTHSWAGENLVGSAGVSIFTTAAAGGGLDLVRAIADTVGLSETLARSMALARPVAEAAGIGEATARARTLARRRDETGGIPEASVRAIAMTRLRPETEGLTETRTRARALARLRADAVGLVESVSRTLGLAQVVSDVVGLAETTARTLGLAQVVSDVVGLTHQAARILGLVRPVAEGAGIGEATARPRTLARRRDETEGLVGTRVRARLLIRRAADALSIIAGSVPARLRVRVRDEALGITETIARFLGDVVGALICGSMTIYAAVEGAISGRAAVDGAARMRECD